MKTIWSKLTLIFFISLLLSVGLAFLRSGEVTILGLTGFPLSSLVGFVVLGVGTAWCIQKNKEKIKPVYIILTIWLGISLLELPVRILDFSFSLISLPNLVIWWLGILIGYIYSLLRNNIVRVCLVVVSLVIVSWGCGPGYRGFLHNLNFGTFNGQVKEYITSPIVFNDENKKNIKLASLKGRYIVLDFWTSSCGVCFQEFPEVQKLFNELKDNKDFSLYSVHCFNVKEGELFDSGQKILNEGNYSFPSISVPTDGYTVKLLNIKAYPTVLLIDKESNMIIHRGNLRSAKKTIDKLNT